MCLVVGPGHMEAAHDNAAEGHASTTYSRGDTQVRRTVAPPGISVVHLNLYVS